MKNPILRALLLGAAIGGLIIGATPAQAASVTWEDPKDDAVYAVLPNDPAFDITTVTISNDGGGVTWQVSIPELAEATPTGYTFRMFFTQGDVAFRFQVAENLLGEQTSNVAPTASATPLPAAPLECEKCEGKIDREAKKVVFTAPLASLDKALKSVEGAGSLSEWTGLSVIAYRPLSAPNPGGALPASGVLLVLDTAAAPEGTALAF